MTLKRLVIISVLLFTSIIITLAVYLGLISAKVKNPKDNSCRIMDGTTHIYQGQCLPEDYIPDDLVPLSPRASWLKLEPRLALKAKIMIEQLIENAEKDGMCLVVSSGYRSYEEQEELYNSFTEDRKDQIAVAGSSEHQTGLAVDFKGCPLGEDGKRDDTAERLELRNDFEDLPEYIWLTENADRYGFERSFYENNMDETGYPSESWHWMFIGE